MVGKKKRGHPDLDEILARPWCYYCERDFDDLKILISHQKAKHFKCERCSRRLNTAGGLSVHMNQVHKETLTSVDNALGNRASLDVEIFGMEGIPEDVKQAHNQRIIAQFYQAETDRRAASGNHGAGAGGGNVSKKPKFEAPGDLKARLAAHKAKKAELAANGGVSSGDQTPVAGVQNSQSPAPGLSPSFSNSPFAPPPVPYGAPPPAAGYGFSAEPYGQAPPSAFAPPYQQPPFAAPGAPYAPPPVAYGAVPPYPPQPSFSPGPFQQSPFGAPPPQFGAGTPPPFNPYQPPPHAPGSIGSLPARPASLPQAPGLPSRPSFSGPPGGPPGGQFSMHQPPPQQGGWGQQNGWNGPEHHNPAMSSAYPPQNQGYNDGHAANARNGASKEPDDIDEMIRQAELGIKPAKKGDTISVPAPAPPAHASQPPAAPAPTKKEATPEVTEKKSKKEKEVLKMVYKDNEVSPEEKMAKLPRYAFVPEKKDEATLVDANQVPGVAGTVDN